MSDNLLGHPIYIVDDEESLSRSFGIALRSSGFSEIKIFNQGQEVLDLIPDLECKVMLLDLFMPGVSGEEVLKQVRDSCPQVQVVVVTGNDETDTAVRCIKSGAFDYLVKPVEQDRLITTVRRAMSHSLLLYQNARLRQKLLTGKLDCPEAFQGIITQDQAMKRMFSYLEVVAPASDPVLITGETGTGKDLVASALHKLSRRGGEFVSLNVAGLDDNVFADTLFGHVRGAFTDAHEHRKGLVEQAEGGTLFLDEIGDLSQSSQIKLLKLVQDHVYLPLGSDKPKKANARIIAATNQDLDASKEQGGFRADLYYRINTYQVHLPPLRERGSDVLLLAEHFFESACKEHGVEKHTLNQRIITILSSYDFPGNVRQLRSLVYAAVAGGGMEYLEKSLASLMSGLEDILPENNGSTARFQDWFYPEPLPTLEEAGEKLISQALQKTQGNQAKAALILGISRQALNKRLKKRQF
ncbi:sigma-54-dependent transcriptional regulator [Desulfonatronovibrio hydrogenovorans]|uniref:sigma-54-dependent transcriptional regulator n=1 Tax=Desulfonatronovibrio hydrogenovorans TaxID=53245 RepID=UPI00049081C9|nr:sigma-54 dependent transcriptional regulator [Desulfonatronovibrio hydrogenovorans]